MPKTIIDLHLIQTVPPSNLNRDDTGSPKSAVFGGVRRARVSSQAWKHAVREAFKKDLNPTELGTRTKRVVELLSVHLAEIVPDATDQEIQKYAEKAIAATGIKIKEPKNKTGAKESGYLLFLSNQQINALANLASEALLDQSDVDKRAAQGLVKGKNSLDIALFGRMVADVTDLNVDASCQVAHALSTHAVETEYDYFTAVDDVKAEDEDEDAGAGMIGTVEFNTATLYRFATIDVGELNHNLGDNQATVTAITAFIDAFVKSMPTGKQNTFANRTLPDVAIICVRDDRAISWVGAFEEPVVAGAQGGIVNQSSAKLVDYANDLASTYGSPPIACFTTGVGAAGETVAALGEALPFDETVDAVASLVSQRLSGPVS